MNTNQSFGGFRRPEALAPAAPGFIAMAIAYVFVGGGTLILLGVALHFLLFVAGVL
jgi:hypothetical protein